MTQQATSIAKTYQTVSKNVFGEAFMHQLRMAVGQTVDPSYFARTFLTTIKSDAKLLKCTQDSLLYALMFSGQTRLPIDPVLGKLWIIPFGNKAQVIIGYKGLIDLARRSGEISTIQSHAVYQEDEFDYRYGLDPKLDHTPCNNADKGDLIGAYAVARLKDGGYQFDYMTRHDIDLIRAKAPGGNSDAWKNHYAEMAKKTVLRRLCKLLPASIDLQRAVSLDEMYDAGKEQDLRNAVDVEPIVQEQPPTALENLTEDIANGE